MNRSVDLMMQIFRKPFHTMCYSKPLSGCWFAYGGFDEGTNGGFEEWVNSSFSASSEKRATFQRVFIPFRETICLSNHDSRSRRVLATAGAITACEDTY